MDMLGGLARPNDAVRAGNSMNDAIQTGGFAGLRVMVIDDSKTIRRTAETLLKKEGCEVVTANDGCEALAKIADQHPQVTLVEIMMPPPAGPQTTTDEHPGR